jgi:hypothetical protein
MRWTDCAVIRIRYKDICAGTHEVAAGLHGMAERGPGGVTVYLLPGLTTGQRRAVIRRLRQEASRGFGPPLPLPQLAVALGLDRVATAARIVKAIVRLHPAVTLVPGAFVVAMMALFVIAAGDRAAITQGAGGGLADAAVSGSAVRTVSAGPGYDQATQGTAAQGAGHAEVVAMGLTPELRALVNQVGAGQVSAKGRQARTSHHHARVGRHQLPVGRYRVSAGGEQARVTGAQVRGGRRHQVRAGRHQAQHAGPGQVLRAGHSQARAGHRHGRGAWSTGRAASPKRSSSLPGKRSGSAQGKRRDSPQGTSPQAGTSPQGNRSDTSQVSARQGAWYVRPAATARSVPRRRTGQSSVTASRRNG